MYFLRIIPAIIMSIVFGSYFIHLNQPGLVFIALLSPLLLVLRYRWTLYVYQMTLTSGAILLILTIVKTSSEGTTTGIPLTRDMVIMGFLSICTLLAVLLLGAKPLKQRYSGDSASAKASITAFAAVAILSSIIHIKMSNPILFITERLLPGSGWIEIAALSLYAGLLTGKMVLLLDSGKLRGKIWTAFSIIFYGQLLLGLSGFQIFFMTGKLHIPVPAMIIAGPVYRGSGSLFMPILFIGTVLLAGPSWCSWFCYFGNWDYLASKSHTIPQKPVKHPFVLRSLILFILILAAFLFRNFRVPVTMAVISGILFGIFGLVIIYTFSRRSGIMLHCTSYCPIGLFATLIGKINPFRIHLSQSCTECYRCIQSCKYSALSKKTIKNRRPGATCTLCGDCIASCSGNHLSFYFPGLNYYTARSVFLVIVIVIHTLFIGIARV